MPDGGLDGGGVDEFLRLVAVLEALAPSDGHAAPFVDDGAIVSAGNNIVGVGVCDEDDDLGRLIAIGGIQPPRRYEARSWGLLCLARSRKRQKLLGKKLNATSAENQALKTSVGRSRRLSRWLRELSDCPRKAGNRGWTRPGLRQP